MDTLIIVLSVLALAYVLYQRFKRTFEIGQLTRARAPLESKEQSLDSEIAKTREELKKLTDDYEFQKQVYKKKFPEDGNV